MKSWDSLTSSFSTTPSVIFVFFAHRERCRIHTQTTRADCKSITDRRSYLTFDCGRTFGRVWMPSNLVRTVSCSHVYCGGGEGSRGRRAPSSGLTNVPQPQPPQQAVTGQQGAVVSTPRRPAQPRLIVYLLALQIRSLASFITYARTPAAR